MADIRKDTRFLDFLASKNMSVDAFEAADDDLKAALSTEIDDWKEKNPLDVEEKEGGYSIEEAVEIGLNQNLNMMPDELVALNDTLKEAAKAGDDEVKKAYDNIQKAMGIKTKQYADGKIGVDIDHADSMIALLDAYEAGDDKTIQETKKKAQERLDGFVKKYDEDNGLTDLTPENSGYVDDNSTILEGIGNENLFEREVFVEQDVVPMSFDKAKEILTNKAVGDLSVQDVASLQVSMQIYSGSFSKEDNYVVSKAARAKVLGVANSKDEEPLSKEDFASFDFILSGVEKSAEKNAKLIDAKKLNKAKDILKDQREVTANTVFTKYPEMQNAYNLLSAIKVTGKLKRFSREEIQQKDENGAFLPESEMGLFIESIKERTKQQMLTNKEEIKPEVFQSNFSTNLEVAIFELYGAERIALGKTSPKDSKETYDKLMDLSKKGKKISINQESFAGYAALKNKDANSFIKRLEAKTGNIQAVETSRKNNKELDKKNEQVHGDKYKGAKNFFRTMGKTVLKAAAWSAAFSVASTVGAPAVVAVAAASLGVQLHGAIKGYKKEKIEAAKNGKKLGFWGYMKKNPAVGIGIFTGALGGVVPGLEILGEAGNLGAVSSSLTSSLGSFRFGSTMAAASVGAYKPIVNAIKNPSKENLWGAATAIGGVAAGMLAGQLIGGQINEYNAGNNSVDTSVDGMTGAAVQVQSPVTTLNADMNPSYDYSNPSSNFNYFDANNNGVLDFLESSDLSKILNPSSPQVDLTADANGNGLPDYLEVNAPEQTVEQALDTKTQPTQETPVQEMPKEQVVENVAKETPEQTEQKSQETQQDKTVETETKEQTPQQTQIETREDQPSVEQHLSPEELAAVDRTMAEQTFQDKQDAAYGNTYAMTDSLGQTADYQVEADGNILFTNTSDGFTGHEDMGNDIAKNIMERVENGTATEGDLKAMERYSKDSELLAEAQGKFGANKESFIAEKQGEYSQERVAADALKAETQTADNNKTGEELADTKGDNTENKEEVVTKEADALAENRTEESKTQEDTNKEDIAKEAVAKQTVETAALATSIVSDLKVDGFDSRTVSQDGTVALKNDQYSVSYKVGENGNISMSANGAINPDYEVKNHCSKMYQLDNGNYKMGDSVSPSMSAVQMMANNDLRMTTLHNALYSDMEARVEAGEQLSASEAKFMDRHEAKLEKLDIHRDEDGSLKPGKESDVKANTQQASVENATKEPEYKISKSGTLTYVNNSSPDVTIPDDVKASLAAEQLGDGRYKAGDVIHKDPAVAMQKANLDLNNLYKNNDAYNDLAERRDSGGELDKRETKFLANHEKKMDAFNLVSKDGQIEVNPNANEGKQSVAENNNQGKNPKGVDLGIGNRRAIFGEANETVSIATQANTVIKDIAGFFGGRK